MKKYLYSFTAAAFLVFSPIAMAADEIAVVNIQQVMRDSTAAKSVREQLEGKQKAFQADIAKKAEQLQKEKQDIDKQRSVLSKDAFDEKARSFMTKETDVQKEVEAKKALLNNAFERALTDIQKAVTDIISDMAKEKGFIVALPTSQILYADSKLDISSEVLTRLNQKLPHLDVKFDAVSSDSKSKKQ